MIYTTNCVQFYLGFHPFGESFRRQANILSGEYTLNHLTDSDHTSQSLISRMISLDAYYRPSTPAVLKHPIFWSNERKLNFLQDVSDRIDKEDSDSAVVIALERGKENVFFNWQDDLDEIVRTDLRKHRSYNPKSVRDLLR